MSSRKPNRTTRRLLKIVSLGIAGLLAGLLTGCFAPSNPFRVASYPQNTGSQLNPASRHQTHHLKTFDPRPIPSLKHPPLPHRLIGVSRIDPRPALTNYIFVSSHSHRDSDSRH